MNLQKIDGQDVDHVVNEPCRKWIMQEMDRVENGRFKMCRKGVVQKMDHAKN